VGLPGQRRLRSSARDPWRGLVPVSSATVASISRMSCDTLAPESRHEVASRVQCMASLVFATCRSCDRATCLLAPLFAHIADGCRALCTKGGKSLSQWPARVRSTCRFSENSRFGCAHAGRKVHESRCCPPMVRRRGTRTPTNRLPDTLCHPVPLSRRSHRPSPRTGGSDSGRDRRSGGV